MGRKPLTGVAAINIFEKVLAKTKEDRLHDNLLVHNCNFFTLDLSGNWLSQAMHLVISVGFTVSQMSHTSLS